MQREQLIERVCDRAYAALRRSRRDDDLAYSEPAVERNPPLERAPLVDDDRPPFRSLFDNEFV